MKWRTVSQFVRFISQSSLKLYMQISKYFHGMVFGSVGRSYCKKNGVQIFGQNFWLGWLSAFNQFLCCGNIGHKWLKMNYEIFDQQRKPVHKTCCSITFWNASIKISVEIYSIFRAAILQKIYHLASGAKKSPLVTLGSKMYPSRIPQLESK